MPGNTNSQQRVGVWLSDLPLSHKLSLLVWIYLVIIILLVSASIFSLRALSADRGFVNAEGLWSKAQKDATLYLTLYALDGDPGHYSTFRRQLSLFQGFRDAVAEMDRPSPDLSRVAKGFVQGGITPDDAPEMAWLYNRFRHLSYAERALATWREGDRLVLEIGRAAEELRKKREADRLDSSGISTFLSDLERFDQRLTVLENRFSEILGELSQWMKKITILILLITALLLVLTGTGLSLLISRRIREGVMIIRNGAERVGMGDLTSRIEVESRDELGALAMDLNRMTADLQESRDMLRRSEERYRFLVENIPQGIFYKDRESVYVACNRAFADDLGISASDIAGKTDFDFFPPELAEKYRRTDRSVMGRGGVMEFDEGYLKNGLEKIVHTVKAPIRDDEGRVMGILGVFWDITERKLAEDRLRHRLAQDEVTYRISSRFSLATDLDAAINESLEDMGRLGEADRAYLFSFSDDGSLMSNTHEWCKEGVSPQIRSLREIPSASFPWWVERLKKGDEIMITDVSAMPPEAEKERAFLEAQEIRSLLVIPVRIAQRLIGFIGFDSVRAPGGWSDEALGILRISSEIIANALERDRIGKALREASITDELTGLYNRRGFQTLARQQIKVADRTMRGMFLCFIDIDDLKEINDTLGHARGDAALQETADILRETFRESDIMGRFGGDEFSVLVVNAENGGEESISSRLAEVLQGHNSREGRDYTLSLSMGTAGYDPAAPSSLDELVSRADSLMYNNKRRKRDCFMREQER